MLNPFQSAPALCRAGDPICGKQVDVADTFQSAPALCRAGDTTCAICNSPNGCFNPRPLFAERATRVHVFVVHHSPRFNPRPLFAERATQHRLIEPQRVRVSIRARSLQSGRHATARASSGRHWVSIRARSLQSGRRRSRTNVCSIIDVSIRARSLQSGRHAAFQLLPDSSGFQSAPALCRAGDDCDGRGLNSRHSFNPRPLFAERATAARRTMCRLMSVSIRARSLQSGRHERPRAHTRQSRRFNPRPLFAERATHGRRQHRACRAVSIRARSLQSGRRQHQRVRRENWTAAGSVDTTLS